MKNTVTDLYEFIEYMKNRSWVVGNHQYELVKDDWIIVFDTSSWIEIGMQGDPRIFDVPIPDKRLQKWTENLITHLCETSDALHADRSYT